LALISAIAFQQHQICGPEIAQLMLFGDSSMSNTLHGGKPFSAFLSQTPRGRPSRT
jgi:hypothetical protein